MSAPDRFRKYTILPDSPGVNAFVITPSANTLPEATRAIYVGTSGNLDVTFVGGGRVTFTGIQPGFYPLRLSRVWNSANTTASNLVGIV